MTGMVSVADGQVTEREQVSDLELARRITVAIPVLNEAAHIETRLRSLVAGLDADIRDALELIVSDGGSSDGTVEIVKQLSVEFSGLKLIDNPAKYQSAGVNRAAEIAADDRDILIRCDAHSIYPEKFLLKAARSYFRQEAHNLVMPMDAVGESCFQKANAWIVDTPLGSGGSPHRGGKKSGLVDHGHHGVFNRAKFLELGGYDETFTHNEDAEFDARLARAGGRIYLDADIRIGYLPRGSGLALARQYFGYGKGRALNILKNSGGLRLRQMIPVANLLLLVMSLLLSFWAPVFLVWPLLYLSILVAASLWMAVRHQSVCGLFSGIALGVMHISWASGFLKGVIRHVLQRKAAA